MSAEHLVRRISKQANCFLVNSRIAFKKMHKETFNKFFTTYSRSKSGYAVQFWLSLSKKHKDLLEKVEVRTTK